MSAIVRANASIGAAAAIGKGRADIALVGAKGDLVLAGASIRRSESVIKRPRATSGVALSKKNLINSIIARDKAEFMSGETDPTVIVKKDGYSWERAKKLHAKALESNPTNLKGLRAEINDAQRESAHGTYYTGPWEGTQTYYNRVEMGGRLNYTTGEDAQLEDMELLINRNSPIIISRNKWTEEAAGSKTTSSLKFTMEDVAKTTYKGKKFVIELLPGRDAKKLIYNTKNGKLKIKTKSGLKGFFERPLETQASVYRQLGD